MKEKPFKKFILVCIVALIILSSIYGSIIYLSGFNLDKISILTNFLVAYATFVAACIAVLLYNDWRDEKNYELNTSYLRNIFSNLRPIHKELITIRSQYLNIKKTNEHFVYYTSYINRQKLDIYSAILNLYSDIKIYSELIEDNTLVELYSIFDKKCFHLEFSYKNLIGLYKNYYDKASEITENLRTLDDYEFSRKYAKNARDQLKNEILIISLFFQNKQKYSIDDNTINIFFKELLDETIDLHDKIEDFCIKNLKPK